MLCGFNISKNRLLLWYLYVSILDNYKRTKDSRGIPHIGSGPQKFSYLIKIVFDAYLGLGYLKVIISIPQGYGHTLLE